ncbi:MAG: hypothetical protein M9929_16760, partial [Burkholderiaceae bacterium]|nr:hypothetical protein [Burkholderiaceae bacterium]
VLCHALQRLGIDGRAVKSQFSCQSTHMISLQGWHWLRTQTRVGNAPDRIFRMTGNGSGQQ